MAAVTKAHITLSDDGREIMVLLKCQTTGCDNLSCMSPCINCQSIVALSGTVAPRTVGFEIHDCPICLRDIAVNTLGYTIISCGHTYHPNCLSSWFKLYLTCPMCRADVRPQK